MHKLVWLLLSAIPPGVVAKFDAPKWAVALALVPFLLIAMSLGDSDEELLGEASGTFRKGALILLGIGGVVLGVVVLVLWKVLFPRT